MSEVYISVDIEADGPIPGPHSMLSLGAAAFAADGTLLGTASYNLETLPGATPDEATTKWWRERRTAYEATRVNQLPPLEAMTRFAAWIETFGGQPVMVGYPASYDFMFVHWYMMRFLGYDPLGFAAIDIKSYAMAALKCSYRSARRNMPKAWIVRASENSHIAVNDAQEQGEMFVRMKRATEGT